VKLPPRLDPLGRKAPSRGPVQRSINFSCKASASATLWAAGAAVSAERLRAVVHAGVPPGAVLQRGVPDGRGALASVEGAAALPSDGRWSGVSSRTEPTPTPASPRSAPDRRPHGPPLARPRVGHHPAKKIRAPVTALAAMPCSRGPVARRCSDSAHGPVDRRWNA